MAYEKTIWTNGATALSAENMNHIENGIAALDEGKVDKENGKGLSANDYTSAEKTKLANIPANANYATFKSVTTDVTASIQAHGSYTMYIPLDIADTNNFLGVRSFIASNQSTEVSLALGTHYAAYDSGLGSVVLALTLINPGSSAVSLSKVILTATCIA